MSCPYPTIVGIVGGRRYPRMDDVAAFVDSLPADAMVVSGEASGVDSVARGRALARGLAYRGFAPAGFGARFLLDRNTDIVLASFEIAAFWDLASRGTSDSIVKAIVYDRPLVVYGPDGAPVPCTALLDALRRASSDRIEATGLGPLGFVARFDRVIDRYLRPFRIAQLRAQWPDGPEFRREGSGMRE